MSRRRPQMRVPLHSKHADARCAIPLYLSFGKKSGCHASDYWLALHPPPPTHSSTSLRAELKQRIQARTVCPGPGSPQGLGPGVMVMHAPAAAGDHLCAKGNTSTKAPPRGPLPIRVHGPGHTAMRTPPKFMASD